jgi:hypothetical protein
MEPNRPEQSLSLLAGKLSPSFRLRKVVVAPGSARAYEEDEWRGALVVVESGEIELESLNGSRQSFRRGHTLWLVGLPLRALNNQSSEPALLVAVSRRPKSMFVAMSCSNRSPHGPISFQLIRRLDSQNPTTRRSTT